MVQTPSHPPMQSIETQSETTFRAARAGDPGAIARLISRALANQGITAQAMAEGSHLHLILESRHLPDQQTITPLIQRGMMRLGARAIQSVSVQARLLGDTRSAQADQRQSVWNYQFQIASPPSAPLYQQPDAESLVRVHVGGAVNGDQVAIGQHITQITNHGTIVYPRQAARPVPKLRSKPTAQRYCQPFRDLLDRHPERQEALTALTNGTSVEFYGEAGLGKSALLRHLAYHNDVAHRFSSGVVYHLVYNRAIDDVAQVMFDAFYEYSTAIPTKPTNADLREALERLNGLAILDQVDLDDASLEQLMTLPGLTFLLASPGLHTGHEGRAIPMRGLPVPDAIELIERQLGRVLRDSERQDAETVCRLLKGHPLRIIQNMAPIREASRQPEPKPDALTLQRLASQLQAGMPSETLTVRAVTTLPEIERRILAVLALFGPVPLTPEHLRALTAATNLDLAFQILLERGLIWTESGRYGLASNLIQPLNQIWDLAPWVERSLSYFLDWGLRQEVNISPLLQNGDVLWQLVSKATEQRLWVDVLKLTQMLDRPLALGKQWGRWQQMWELGLEAARSLGDGAAQGYALHQLGTRALCLEDAFTAHTYLTEAMQLRHALGDRIGTAVTQHNLNLLLPPPPLAQPAEAPEPEAELVVAPSHPPVVQPTQLSQVAVQPPPATQVSAPPSKSTRPWSGPWLWLGISALMALMGGVGAYVALTWNRAPFVIEPNSLSFTPQLLSIGSDPRVVRVTNQGNETINISSIAFSEGDRLDFSVTEETCTDQPLRPDDDCTVSVVFQPRESGPRATRLRIADRTGEFVRSISVRGVGEAAEVSFEPDGLAFEPAMTGRETPAVQSITVVNDGAVSFTMGQSAIAGERTDAFAVNRDGCAGQALDPGDTCTVEVGFNPPGAGQFEANLAVTDSTGEYTWLSPLIGTGQLSAPAIAPASLPFDAEVIGTLATDDIAITNTGTSPLIISDVSISGDTDNFSIRGNTCTRNPVQPGERCRVTIGFNPLSERSYGANLVITDNAVNSPRRVALSGRGTRVAAPSITPSRLVFGEQEVGTARQENLILTNRGTGNIRINSISIGQSGDFGIINQTCEGATLTPGTSCGVAVGFTPQGTGDRSTTITISDSAVGSPRTVEVTGTGISIPAPQILSMEASPSQIEPGDRSNICYRTANVRQLTLRNDATGRLTPVDAGSGCAQVTPGESTTYTLIAEGQNGQTVTRQVRVAVVETDTTAPPTPNAIAPAGNSYVLCPSNPSALLDWDPVSDPSSPVSYIVTLQTGGSSLQQTQVPQGWSPVLEQTTTATEFDVTQYVQRGRISYRWQVSARDAAGNQSGASPWLYFRTCDFDAVE